MKFGVIVFPGSNCDRDILMVTQGILGIPTRMVWHQETDIHDLDAIIVPGGFSYGDYLRCGAKYRAVFSCDEKCHRTCSKRQVCFRYL